MSSNLTNNRSVIDTHSLSNSTPKYEHDIEAQILYIHQNNITKSITPDQYFYKYYFSKMPPTLKRQTHSRCENCNSTREMYGTNYKCWNCEYIQQNHC